MSKLWRSTTPSVNYHTLIYDFCEGFQTKDGRLSSVNVKFKEAAVSMQRSHIKQTEIFHPVSKQVYAMGKKKQNKLRERTIFSKIPLTLNR